MHLIQFISLPANNDNQVIPFLTLLVTIGTLIIAALALTTWRKQLKGSHDFELARRINVSLYELRYQIKGARSPYVEGEINDAYANRWTRVVEPAKILQSSLFEAQILWDKDTYLALDAKVSDLLARLRWAIDAYLLSKNEQYASIGADIYTKNERNVLYSGIQQPKDEFAQEVDDLVDEFEELLSTKLKV